MTVSLIFFRAGHLPEAWYFALAKALEENAMQEAVVLVRSVERLAFFRTLVGLATKRPTEPADPPTCANKLEASSHAQFSARHVYQKESTQLFLHTQHTKELN